MIVLGRSKSNDHMIIVMTVSHRWRSWSPLPSSHTWRSWWPLSHRWRSWSHLPPTSGPFLHRWSSWPQCPLHIQIMIREAPFSHRWRSVISAPCSHIWWSGSWWPFFTQMAIMITSTPFSEMTIMVTSAPFLHMIIMVIAAPSHTDDDRAHRCPLLAQRIWCKIWNL